MALGIYEAAKINVAFTGDDGLTVMVSGTKSDAFDGGYHMYRDRDGVYLGLIIYNADRASWLVYDANGSPLEKRYKTANGAVKRLYRIRQDATAVAAADVLIPCDACGYDIEPTDDEAQSTEVGDEVISTCGGCGDELGTLVLDAKEGVLNREAPRGKRPAAVDYSGPYVNRTGERYNVTALHTGAYVLRKCHTGAGYTNVTGADMKSWIASGWLSRAEDVAQATVDEVVDEDVDDGATTTEQVFDRLAVSLALSAPVIDRLRKSIVDDDGTERPAPRMTGDYSRCRSCGVAIDYGRSYCGGGRCIGLASETSDATAMRRAYV